MGRPLNQVPTYVYKEKDRARIYWRGEYRDLPGKFRSAKSLAAYQSMCLIVEATGLLPPQVHSSEVITIKELGRRYLAAMRIKFGPESDEPTYRSYSIKAVVGMFGSLTVAEFTPVQLKAVRQAICDAGLVRRTANKRAQHLVNMIQWAVEEGLATGEQWQRLKAVEPIRAGQFGSRDNPEKRPVPEAHFQETLNHLRAETADALRVLALTGMRTGELLAMRPQDVEMGERHWFYTPTRHKTMAAIGSKFIAIPEPAVSILVQYMPKDFTKRFFPREQSWLLRAVKRACERADVPHWHPHQLRHLLASKVAEKIDDRAAQKLLGHTNPRMTKKYIQLSKDELADIMDRLS
jgi:integrase